MQTLFKISLTALMLSCSLAQAATTQDTPTLSGGIISQSNVSLRAAPKDSARQQAELWQGEWVEIRGSKLDYLQVYDYKRERGGFIKASSIRRTSMSAAEAPELLAVMRYLRDSNGSESLGISLATAYIKAAPKEAINSAQGAEVLDSIGIFSDRLAQRASSESALSKQAATQLAQALEVVNQYGIAFNQTMRNDHVSMCYNGEVYRHVLAMPAEPNVRAHAALSLTQDTCADPNLTPLARAQLDAWRAQVISLADTANLEPYLKNRVEMRRAIILSALSFARARFDAQPEILKAASLNQPAQTLMTQALQAFAHVQKSELPDSDWGEYNNTAVMVNANRWAAAPTNKNINGSDLQVRLDAGEKGQTCVILSSKQKDALAKRCTYGLVWTQSVSINREKNAVALAVQPLAGWRELWLFRKDGNSWDIQVLPPTIRETNLGYAEFAGWVPGGKQILVARESRSEKIYERKFEVINMDSLSTQRQANDASILGSFQRWQDPSWKAQSVSMR